MKIEHRTSRYLNIIKLDQDDACLLFNGVNGCMDEVPNELGEILSTSHANSLSMLSPSNINFLAQRGHITTLTPDEELARFKDFVAALHANKVSKLTTGGLLLLLSYNCNLACQYCYQQQHRPHKSSAMMTPEMIDRILERELANLLPNVKLKQLAFYGGEPFLPGHWPAIQRVLEHAKRLGITIEAITNATMLDQMIEIFGPNSGQVNKVQISLDGDRDEHDRSRVPLSGAPTFDKIIHNIQLILARGTKVTIRLNLDRKKVETTPTLLAYLQTQKIAGHPNVVIYATPLHDNLCEVDTSNFIDMNDLAKKVFQFGIDLEHPVSLRTNDMRAMFKMKKNFGLTRTTFCMQGLQNLLVVDPFGDLYACFEEAGHSQLRVGHIASEGVEFFPLRETYKSRHLANMADCLVCPVALACGGQCGVLCRAKHGDLFKPYCREIKDVILHGVKLAYQKQKSES